MKIYINKANITVAAADQVNLKQFRDKYSCRGSGGICIPGKVLRFSYSKPNGNFGIFGRIFKVIFVYFLSSIRLLH